MKKIKIIVMSVIVVVLVVVMIAAVSCSVSPEFRVVRVKKGPFFITVHAVGQLESAASIYIGCPPIRRFWNYTISFMAPEGKFVKQGDLILRFDIKELRERLILKQSELETAKKELEKINLVEQETKDNLMLKIAEAQMREKKARRKTLQPDDVIAMNEIKKIRMDLELAEMQVRLFRSRVKNQSQRMKTLLYTQESKIKELESQVSEYRQAIEKLNVKAPKPGILVYAADWTGRKKNVGDRCWVGSKILEISDLSQMQVAAVIPEPEAGKVKEGLPVEIRLDSNPDRVFKGKVKSLGRIFRTKSYDQPTIVFDVTIDILNPDPELMRPGMAAGVDIIVSCKENILQVPESAIIYHEEGLFVRKKSFFGKKMVPVTLGVGSGGMVEVLAGLKENDRVIIGQ
ncbi:MAG: efflux RND transporter periplasmic adaptor subunit [Candidatus Aminicenantes bacterium]|nr:MAG: efflux RND transporter periplasmic adaptor subunit [Candidatus Aminicenantes bacterium]